MNEARVIEQDLEKGLLSFGRGFTVLEDEISEEFAAEIKQAKSALEKVGLSAGLVTGYCSSAC